jgi:hypothetical protein
MDNVYTVLVFAGGILIGVVLGVSRRYLLRVPRLLGRRLKILPRRAKILGRKTGTAGLSSHPKLAGDMPAILRELHVIDDAPPEAQEVYDFSEADRQLVVVKHGFKTYRQPKPDLIASNATDGEHNVELARKFFSSPMQIKTDADNLYDEEEGAVIVRMLRRSDRLMFYAIDKFRCVVGDNARRMVGQSVFAVLFVAFVGLIFQFAVRLNLLPGSIPGHPWSTVGIAAFVALVPIGWLSFRTNVHYNKARDAGFGEFKALLQSYFAGVSDRFVNAHAKMSHSILGEEDQDFLAENAEKSHKTMLWHAMRVLFMENFLRNEYYQMRRNLRFYQLLYGFAVLLGILVALSLMLWIGTTSSLGWLGYAQWFFFAGACLLGAAAWIFSIGKKDTEHQISDLHWRGFAELHMDDRLREIIGAYAKEAGIGKHRFSRGRA